jgi:PTH1 family peptidyl-tRNA hydrolase
MDITLGKIKIKRKGRAGGHNGVKSIISHLGEEFIRIKCSIGKPKRTEEVVNFVLDTFSKKDRVEEIEPLIETASKAAKSMITAKSIDRVIEKFNRK